MRKKVKVIGISVIVLVVLGVAGMVTYFKKNVDAIDSIKVSEADLSKLEDGSYLGACDAGFIAVKVKVAVKDHQFQSIDVLKHQNGKGAAAEKITDEIIQKQKINVDAISGASKSSKVIKKAVEDAVVD